MDSSKINLDQKIRNPNTSLGGSALLGALYGAPTIFLIRSALGKPIEPWRIAAGAALGAGVGMGVNAINRKYFSNEIKEWEKENKMSKAANVLEKIALVGKGHLTDAVTSKILKVEAMKGTPQEKLLAGNAAFDQIKQWQP